MGTEDWCRKTADDLTHIRHAVRTGVVDAHVDEVSTFLHLIACHRRGLIKIACESIASRNCLDPLALVRSPMTRKESSCSEWDETVERSGARPRSIVGFDFGTRSPQRSTARSEVFWSCAAASTDNRDPKFGREVVEVVGKCFRSKVVVHPAVSDRGVRRLEASISAIRGECAER